MNTANKKGFFITFEGAEGSGKSTQVKLLSDFLHKEKIDFIITREPGGTEISEQIRAILLDPANTSMSGLTEFLLYSASRAQHVYEKIKPSIENGKIVISDRFSFASLAYQGYGRGLNLQMINEITKTATQSVSPDLIFLLDIEPSIGVEKAKLKSQKIFSTSSGGDRLENEDLNFHNKVRNGYIELSKTNSNVCFIEYATVETVHFRIISELYKCGILQEKII